MCRVTVLTRHSEVDLALPLGVPLALLMGGVVDLVAAHRPHNDFDASPERVEPEAWTLARIGRPPLPGSLSLDESGIRDGEILVLEEAAAPAPPPLFDDVMYSVAVAGRDGLRRWSDRTAAAVATYIAPSAVALGCGALLTLPDGTERIVAGVVTSVLMLLLVGAAALVARLRTDGHAALLSAVCALPAAFTSGMLLVPGEYSAAHVLLATVLTGAVAVIALGLLGAGTATFTAVAAVTTVGGLALTASTTASVSVPALGAAVVVTALLLLTFAPRLAMMLAALPLPPVPAPGTSLDPVLPDPDDRNPMPSLDVLEAKATRARSHLTGLVYAATVLAVGGAWSVLRQADTELSWPGVGLAVATGFTLVFRGRTYMGADKATPLVVGGAVLLLGTIVGVGAGGAVAPQVLFGAAMVMFAGTSVFGFLMPRRSFSPVQRRFAELVEYAVIVTIVPLACWVGGLYAVVRGL